ncbi:hypothetical protein VQ056_11865 [Paenibacillus sp. JTLBN-2024]
MKGLAKKVLLANNIGLLWTSVKAEPFAELSRPVRWLGDHRVYAADLFRFQRVFRYGARPRQKYVRLRFHGKLPLSL